MDTEPIKKPFCLPFRISDISQMRIRIKNGKIDSILITTGDGKEYLLRRSDGAIFRAAKTLIESSIRLY